MARALVIALVFACGGPKTQAPITSTLPPTEPTPTKPASSEPTCAAALEHSVELSLRENQAKMTPEQAEAERKTTLRFLPLAVTACTEDEWSVELRRCLLDAKTDAESQPCQRLITPEQRQAFERRMQAAD